MKHVIIGAGTVGRATASRLTGQGHQVHLVSRNGGGPGHEGIERVACDATDADALARVCRGATAVYNCASPSSYARWVTDWPPLAAGILDAARRSDAVLVTLSNLYGYGPVDGPMTESTPLDATGVKGRIRSGMWRDALDAHRAGSVRATEARASDFFGPGFTTTVQIGTRVVPRVLAGKTVRVLGDPDAPHTWTYLEDVSRTLAVLGTDPRAWGRAWHVPSGPPVSQRRMIDALARAAGVDAPPVVSLPGWSLRAMGMVSPSVRELHEVRYQFDDPFVMDSSAFTRTFAVTATPFDDAVSTTVRWWRKSFDHRAQTDAARCAGVTE